MKEEILIYGSTGYTGSLITRYAKDLGLNPILSGRNAEKLAAQTKEFGFRSKAIGLQQSDQLSELLKDVKVVIHCAGPFIKTSSPMVEACLKTRTHYIDITGEIAVFQSLHARDEEAKKAGIVILPGVGFDIVPTDCLAAMLHSRMPDAMDLKMALKSVGGRATHGTLKSALGVAANGNVIRKDGQLRRERLGKQIELFEFGKGLETGVGIPLPDVFTAGLSTSIPNIRVYSVFEAKSARSISRFGRFASLLRWPFIRRFVEKRIDKMKSGPNEKQLENGYSLILGVVENTKGEKIKIILQTSQGYKFTAKSALLIASKLVNGVSKTGFHTPSSLLGREFVLEVPDTTLNLV